MILHFSLALHQPYPQLHDNLLGLSFKEHVLHFMVTQILGVRRTNTLKPLWNHKIYENTSMIIKITRLVSSFFFNREIPQFRRNSSHVPCILEMKIPPPLVELEKKSMQWTTTHRTRSKLDQTMDQEDKLDEKISLLWTISGYHFYTL